MPSAITIKKIDGKPGQVYYPLERISLPPPTPSPTQVVVRITAAALNHRDLFIRQHLYPGTTFGIPLCADGVGEVTHAGTSPHAQSWLHKRVVLNPGTGWTSSPTGPESPTGYAILGGTKHNPTGTLATHIVIAADQLEPAPAHLSAAECAALPLAGLTAWRAWKAKSTATTPGQNILVTGIGGGVALMVLLFAAAAGVNVYVTSGDASKLARAKELGAAGGVNYKEDGWAKKLAAQLPRDRPYLDAIIDGAGGAIVDAGVRLLKAGGVVAQYGMTTGPKMTWNMGAVLKNIELRGSTMGSRREFAEMVRFVAEKGLRPVVSRVVKGGVDNVEGIDGLFEDMKTGSQFGKLVVEMEAPKEAGSKL